jgi:hypothetical protein
MMELSDISNSAKNYPIAYGSGILSLFLLVYFYFSLSSLPEYRQQVTELEQEVLVLKNNFRDGTDLELDYEVFKDGFEKVRSRLIDRYQIADNNGFFYSLGQSHPVEIISVSQKPVINETNEPGSGNIWALKHYPVVPFEMEVVGLLTDILDFLYVMDQCDRFISVESFDLAIATNREPGYMRISLGINVLGKPLNQTEENR